MFTAERIISLAERFERNLNKAADFDNLQKIAEQQNMLLYQIAEEIRSDEE